MIQYYGYTISPNQIETGEGFLICRNVPIARTGDMEYLPSELGLPGTRIITVHRSPKEVFSPAAMASFEGKPVTDEHPPELLTAETAILHERGHVQNIHRGTGEWEGYVIADLHVHDRALIRAIEGGKREISCGYECEYTDNGDGTYSQRNIRGNHIAVVNRGRAGKRAAILDSDTSNQKKAAKPERKNMKRTGILLKLFGMSVKDRSPEEIEQMAMDTADALEDTQESGEERGIPEENRETKKEAVKDAAFFDALDKKLDTLLKMLDKEPDSQDEKDSEEDAMDVAIKELEGSGEKEDKNKEEAQVVTADSETQEECIMDQAVAAAILKHVRPSIAAIKDEKERKAVADALIASVTAGSDSDMAKIIRAARKNAAKAADGTQSMDTEAVQRAYDNLNPHRKEKK